MKKTLFVVAVIFLMQSQALAQSEELPKFEVAAEFTTLEREAFSQRRTEPGFGGRFTFNHQRSLQSRSCRLLLSKEMFSVPQRRKYHARTRRRESREAV